MEAFFPHIKVSDPPEESDIVGKFCFCILCEYREGDVMTESQQACTHEWIEFTRLTSGALYVDIIGKGE
jgi:C4-type Zn-finger protein